MSRIAESHGGERKGAERSGVVEVVLDLARENWKHTNRGRERALRV